MIDQWLKEIKEKCPSDKLGMILVHNGVVRGTAKGGRQIRAMKLSYDEPLLQRVVEEMKKKEGIVDIRVRINAGELQVGDDIMHVCVAGRFRTDVLPVFQDLLATIKTEIVREDEA